MDEPRWSVTLGTPGFLLKYEGSRGLYEDLLRDAVQPIADGQWKARVAAAPAVAAPAPAPVAPSPVAFPSPSPGAVSGPERWTPTASYAAPQAPPPSREIRFDTPRTPAAALFGPPGAVASPPPPPVAAYRPAPHAAPAVPTPAPAAPAPAAPARGIGGSGWDPDRMIRALAGLESRTAERDAVLTAVVGLAAEGKKDSTPADIKAWLAKHGFPVGDLHVKPILGKLHSRHNHVVPGMLPGTFRPTPAGTAHLFRRSTKA
jgi:hypothetical protein